MPVNANDDNGSPDIMVNGVDTLVPTKRDKDINGPITGEKDLVELKLQTGSVKGMKKVRVSIETKSKGRARIKLWKELNKTTLYLDGTASDHVDQSAECVPKELWIEGMTEGAALREITLHLDPLDKNGKVLCDGAKVAVTVTPVLTGLETDATATPDIVIYDNEITLTSDFVSDGEVVSAAAGLNAWAESKNMPTGGTLQIIQTIQITNNVVNDTIGARLTTSDDTQITKKWDFAAPNAGMTLIDTIDRYDNRNFPFYDKEGSSFDGTKAQYSSTDGPWFSLGKFDKFGPIAGSSTFPLPSKGGNTFVDITYNFNVYACWWYAKSDSNPKRVMYPLGQATWQARFQGTVTPALDAHGDFKRYNFQPGVFDLDQGTTSKNWPQFKRTNEITTPIAQPVANQAHQSWQ